MASFLLHPSHKPPICWLTARKLVNTMFVWENVPKQRLVARWSYGIMSQVETLVRSNVAGAYKSYRIRFIFEKFATDKVHM